MFPYPVNRQQLNQQSSLSAHQPTAETHNYQKGDKKCPLKKSEKMPFLCRNALFSRMAPEESHSYIFISGYMYGSIPLQLVFKNDNEKNHFYEKLWVFFMEISYTSADVVQGTFGNFRVKLRNNCFTDIITIIDDDCSEMWCEYVWVQAVHYSQRNIT